MKKSDLQLRGNLTDAYIGVVSKPLAGIWLSKSSFAAQELKDLLKTKLDCKKRCEQLTRAQQRMLREEILSAKTPATRTKRAAKVLLAR